MIISSINEDTKVDEIRGLSPTISIDQKTVSSNPRSTVGTITEIYDFCRLLYTTVGIQSCPNHPEITLRKHMVSEVASFIGALDEGTKLHLLAPLKHREGSSDFAAIKQRVLDAGFVRFQIGDTLYSVGDDVPGVLPSADETPYIVVDRLVAKHQDESFAKRVRDSIELAYKTGRGLLEIYSLENKNITAFSEKSSCPLCNHGREELSISHFSFNSHQ